MAQHTETIAPIRMKMMLALPPCARTSEGRGRPLWADTGPRFRPVYVEPCRKENLPSMAKAIVQWIRNTEGGAQQDCGAQGQERARAQGEELCVWLVVVVVVVRPFEAHMSPQGRRHCRLPSKLANCAQPRITSKAGPC